MQFSRPLAAPGSAALTRLALTATNTGSKPTPIPASWSQIHLPADHYLHRGAPTEWWWHIGTLNADGRVFGFEINTASYQDRGIGFSQVMLTDVANNKHYQRTTWFVPPQGFDPENWAEHDVTKDWHAGLGSVGSCLSVIDVIEQGSGYSDATKIEIVGGGGSQAVAYPELTGGKITSIMLVNPGRGYTSAPTIQITDASGTGASAVATHSYVTMDAAWGDPTQNMAVTALLVDVKTRTEVRFDLMLSQQGAPFLVLGAGVLPLLPPGRGTHLQTNNYYYSLTKLKASGSISIGKETLAVTGLTWMDHEYGLFGSAANPVRWILQDLQLPNGWSISNFSLPPSGGSLQPGQTVGGYATLQGPDGEMYVNLATSTVLQKPWKSPDSTITYFMELEVSIPDFEAQFTVTSLIESQEFYQPTGSVYEGVAKFSGTFQGQPVSGTAWNEQAMPPPKT
jgi:predicted secreted hydrolase